jgi:hypothetical protein
MSALQNVLAGWGDPRLAWQTRVVALFMALLVLFNAIYVVPPLARECWRWLHEALAEPTRADITYITEADRQKIRARAIAELEADQRKRLDAALTITDRERIVGNAIDRARHRQLIREGRY